MDGTLTQLLRYLYQSDLELERLRARVAELEQEAATHGASAPEK